MERFLKCTQQLLEKLCIYAGYPIVDILTADKNLH